MDSHYAPLPAQRLHTRQPKLDLQVKSSVAATDPATQSSPPNPELNAHRNRLELKTEGMKTEVRRDYIHDYYVLIAPKRAGRPYDVASHDHPMVETASSPRLDLQQEIYTLPDENGGWSVKVVENKFPALTTDNPAAYGQQEIVIDTPLSNIAFGELDTPQIARVLQTYQIRARELSTAKNIQYVTIFRNDGYEAGASLAHAHSQIFALPFVPPRIAQEAATLALYQTEHKIDPFEEILAFEGEAGSRIIAENDSWLCFAPYAPQWQMEAWAVPKRAVSTLSELHAAELQDLAPILKQLVSRLSDYDINHNLSFEQGVHAAQRLMVKIRGRNVVSPWGGLEVSTGVIINTIPSEAAAEWYRRSI